MNADFGLGPLGQYACGRLLAPELNVATLDPGLMYAPEDRAVTPGDLVLQETSTAWMRRERQAAAEGELSGMTSLVRPPMGAKAGDAAVAAMSHDPTVN